MLCAWCLCGLHVPCDLMTVLIGQGTQDIGDLVTGKACECEDLTLQVAGRGGAHLLSQHPGGQGWWI